MVETILTDLYVRETRDKIKRKKPCHLEISRVSDY